MSVMYVATLDILTEKGGFNPEAARAIGEAIDLEIARSREASATRDDLSDCRRALSNEIGAVKAETDKTILELRSEFKILRVELKEALSALRTELKEEISALRAELKADMSLLRAELVRWVFVAIMGQTAMLLGVLYFIKYFK